MTFKKCKNLLNALVCLFYQNQILDNFIIKFQPFCHHMTSMNLMHTTNTLRSNLQLPRTKPNIHLLSLTLPLGLSFLYINCRSQILKMIKIIEEMKKTKRFKLIWITEAFNKTRTTITIKEM